MITNVLPSFYGSQCRIKIVVSEAAGSVWPKISDRRGRTPPTVLLLGKLRWSIFHIV